jgi:hypothetical protein
MCKEFQKIDCTDYEIITFKVERKIFLLAPMESGKWKVESRKWKVESGKWKVAGTAGCECPWCKIFELCNFELLHHNNAHHIRYLCAKS